MNKASICTWLMVLAACDGGTAPTDAGAIDAAHANDAGLDAPSASVDAAIDAADAGADASTDVPPPGCFVAAGTVALSTASGATPPVAFWASQPAQPDDTVLVTAGRLDATATIDRVHVPDWPRGMPLDPAPMVPAWTSTPALSATTRSIAFTLPASEPLGVHAYRIGAHAQTSDPAFVNRPDPWFVIGDLGAAASPGGELVVGGTALDLPGCLDPMAVLVSGTSVVASLPLSRRMTTHGYGVVFSVPASVPAGDYTLYVHNGRGGVLGWSRFASFADAPITTVSIRAADAWPATEATVATGTGDDDARFAAALAMLSGGGTLHVPAGTFHLAMPLVLPNHVRVVGASQTTTTITFAAGIATPLMRGATLTLPNRGTFALEDLTVLADPSFTHGNVVERMFTQELGWFRRVTIRSPAVGVDHDMPAALALRNAASTEITDCTLEASNSLFAREGVTYLTVRGTTLGWHLANAWISARSHSMLFENDTMHQLDDAATNTWPMIANANPGAWFTAFYGDPYESGPFTRDLLWVHNQSTRDVTELQDGRVGQTSDGGTGIYLGHVASVDGTTLHLSSATLAPTAPDGSALSFSWAGAVVQVLDGTGAGQWRSVVSAGPNSTTVVIDRAFDVPLDATSTISVGNFHGHFVFADNQGGNDPLMQQYYLTMDSIVADSTLGMDGIPFVAVAWSGLHYSVTAPAWHYQFLDDTIAHGTRATLRSFVGNATPGYTGNAGAAHVYRRMRDTGVPTTFVLESAHGPFADVLVEHAQTDHVVFSNGGEAVSLSGVVMRDVTTSAGAAVPELASVPAGVSVAP